MFEQPFVDQEEDVSENTGKALHSLANASDVFIPTEGVINGIRIGNAISQSLNIALLLLARAVIAPCEFLLRGRFGERYFSPPIMLISTLMIIALLFSGETAKWLGIILAFSFWGGYGYNNYRCFFRDRRGEYWHSYSDGESRIRLAKGDEFLAKYFFTIDLSKMIIEPLVLLAISGVFYAILDTQWVSMPSGSARMNIFGFYFLWVAIMTFLYQLYGWSMRRNEQLDRKDAQIMLMVENEAAKIPESGNRKLKRSHGVAFIPPAAK